MYSTILRSFLLQRKNENSCRWCKFTNICKSKRTNTSDMSKTMEEQVCQICDQTSSHQQWGPKSKATWIHYLLREAPAAIRKRLLFGDPEDELPQPSKRQRREW